jgi:hypothetical protein
VHPNDDFLSAPELDYDGFRSALREDWDIQIRKDQSGRYCRIYKLSAVAEALLRCEISAQPRTAVGLCKRTSEQACRDVGLVPGAAVFHRCAIATAWAFITPFL